MTKLQKLLADRGHAGERYAKAVHELIEARKELGGHDRALARRDSDYGLVVVGFTNVPLELASLHHEFVRDLRVDWAEAFAKVADRVTRDWDSV